MMFARWRDRLGALHVVASPPHVGRALHEKVVAYALDRFPAAGEVERA